MKSLVPFLASAPWAIAPLLTAIRARRSRSLDEESPNVTSNVPSVSIVIPARDEARSISRCAESVLAAAYPDLEVIIVDDHSADETGRIAAEIAARDARLRVIVPPPLPPGWFGKQWACAAGAAISRGAIIGFLDADTCQAPDLLPRVVNAMQARASDLLTVAGSQELGSFWERLVQPQMFALMLSRFGGTECVNESRFITQKIANGQCLFVRREVYESMGGHAAVRDKVAEDLALAQRFFAADRRVTLVLGLEQLRTRMYTSLRELADGWGKNIYAGGREAMPMGNVGRLFYPVVLLVPWLWGVVPPVLLAYSLLGAFGSGVLLWASIATSANLAWWLLVYRWLGLSPLYALLHPLGSAVLLCISLRAILRGRRVRWKGRDYRST